MRQPTEESFLKDVSQHLLEIKHDDGVHRVLGFARRESFNMGFNIVTYPGYLVYSGDMGCYVFSRIRDMFEFFRGNSLEGALRINLGYWAEKLQATDKTDGHKQYDADRFRAYVLDWVERREYGEEDKQLLRKVVDREILYRADDHEFMARQALLDFEHGSSRPFQDSWEADFTDYTYRFIWCCYALVWAIRQYDRAKRNAS